MLVEPISHHDTQPIQATAAGLNDKSKHVSDVDQSTSTTILLLQLDVATVETQGECMDSLVVWPATI
jgi:hypothetical protein